jgi:hypothetical protein
MIWCVLGIKCLLFFISLFSQWVLVFSFRLLGYTPLTAWGQRTFNFYWLHGSSLLKFSF